MNECARNWWLALRCHDDLKCRKEADNKNEEAAKTRPATLGKTESILDEGRNATGLANQLSQRSLWVHATAMELLPHILVWESDVNDLIQSFMDHDAVKVNEHLSSIKNNVNPQLVFDTLNPFCKALRYP